MKALLIGIGILAALFYQSGVRFTEEARDRGLNFEQAASPTPQKYLIETMGGGCALFDFDGDGYLDVFLANGALLRDARQESQQPEKQPPRFSNRLFRNIGGTRFVDVTSRASLEGSGFSMGAAVGDYDNDGFTDLYVTAYGFNTLYRNNGNGTFSDITDKAGVKAGGWSSSAGFLDFDRDGNLDLFVARYVDWTFETNKYCTDLLPGLQLDPDRVRNELDGETRARSYCHPSNYQGLTDLLFHNRGDGTFEDVSDQAGISRRGNALGVAFGDFNRDHWVDIYVANDAMESFLYRNRGDGTFEEEGLLTGAAYGGDGNAVAGMGTDFGDFNNDGWPDLIVTDLSQENYLLFENSGRGFFREVSEQHGLGRATFLLSGWGVKWVDLDQDGWKDLFLANGHVMDNIEKASPRLTYRQKPSILLNRQGHFVDSTSLAGASFQTPLAARGACFGDLDNDGDIDVVVNSLNDRARLFVNESKSGHSWILIKLIGNGSNREGVGARVVLSAAGREYSAEVSRAGSYLAGHDERLHFGLGNAAKIEKIEVTWPSGIVQRLENVMVGQILEIRETSEGNSSRRRAGRNRKPEVSGSSR